MPLTALGSLTPGAVRRGFVVGLGYGLLIGLTAAVLSVVWSARRVRFLRRLYGQALHEARHDQLTGLPNRAAALEILTRGRVGMVGLLDLDGFKQVNDRHGHHVGDQLLTTIAQRLTTAIGRHGIVARLAGDEFLLLWHRAPAHPVRHATALLRQVTTPVDLEGHHLSPGASLGLALSGPHLSGAGLLTAADAAMYEAKRPRTRQVKAEVDRIAVRLYPADHPPAPIDRRTTGRRTTPEPNPTKPFTSGSSPSGTSSPSRSTSTQPTQVTTASQLTILKGEDR